MESSEPFLVKELQKERDKKQECMLAIAQMKLRIIHMLRTASSLEDSKTHHYLLKIWREDFRELCEQYPIIKRFFKGVTWKCPERVKNSK